MISFVPEPSMTFSMSHNCVTVTCDIHVTLVYNFDNNIYLSFHIYLSNWMLFLQFMVLQLGSQNIKIKKRTLY